MAKLDNNHIVSKTRELMELKGLGLSLNEYKILDIYLSKINPQDESTAKVSFTINEYCKIMKIESNKVREKQIYTYLKHLLDNSVTEWHNNEEYTLHHLFEKVEYRKSENKLYLECARNNFVRKMFFNFDNFQYIKYRLKNTILLKSVYSVKFYLYLLDNKFRGTWYITISDLKKVLEIDGVYYNEFKNLNRKIIKKSIEEINEETNINVEYTAIKVGKEVKKIQFTVYSKQISNEGTNIEEISEKETEDITKEDENREYFFSTERPIGIFINFECLYEQGYLSYIPKLTYDKLFYLFSMVIAIPEVKLKAHQYQEYYLEEQKDDPLLPDFPATEKAVGEYLMKKIIEMKTRNDIKNKYAYLLAMIKEDVKKTEKDL